MNEIGLKDCFNDHRHHPSRFAGPTTARGYCSMALPKDQHPPQHPGLRIPQSNILIGMTMLGFQTAATQLALLAVIGPAARTAFSLDA